MANRFIGRDASLSQAINQIIEEELHLKSPSSADFLGIGARGEAMIAGIGSAIQIGSERLGDLEGQFFIAGHSRWGGSHVVR